jgi:hypothetical protein
MYLKPQRAGGDGRINPGLAPPSGFIAVAMDLAVVASAQRNRELIADLAPERSALGESQVVGIGGLPAANEARLRGDVAHVVTIANPAGFGQRQQAFFDRLDVPF